MGKLVDIATRERRKAPMNTHSSARISFENGVANDSRGKHRGKRQVTVLSQESWILASELMNIEMPWTTRRANLLVHGIDLKNTTGKKLQIGSCLLEVTGELEPCNRMDEQYEGLTSILTPEWRGGVTCKILSEGTIAQGDDVQLLD